MAKPPKKPPKKPKPKEEIETHPDGWARFQKTMDKIVPPKHRPADKGNTTNKKNGDC